MVENQFGGNIKILGIEKFENVGKGVCRTIRKIFLLLILQNLEYGINTFQKYEMGILYVIQLKELKHLDFMFLFSIKGVPPTPHSLCQALCPVASEGPG